ncbi:MAG: ABC transporter permease subunit [Planctomycetota bacterium]
MPIHNVGYRAWVGQKTAQWSRWWHIAETGVNLAFKSTWVKRIVFFAWLPVLYWGLGFFLLERAIIASAQATPETELNQLIDDAGLPPQLQNPTQQMRRQALARSIRRTFPMLPNVDALASALESDDDVTLRNRVWSWLLLAFFRYPQSTVILFLLGFIAPGLISRDFRSRAFLLYFSKPIGRVDYLLGKLFVPALFIIFVSTLPALGLYIFAIGMSPDLSVFYSTWDIPLRIIAASIALVIPTSLLALMLSSLTHESRFASFAWFAIWALGHGAWFSIAVSQAIRLNNAPTSPEVLNSGLVKQWSVVSLYNNLGEVQNWIFGFSSFSEIWPAAFVLTLLSLFSLLVLYRRISAPVNI